MTHATHEMLHFEKWSMVQIPNVSSKYTCIQLEIYCNIYDGGVTQLAQKIVLLFIEHNLCLILSQDLSYIALSTAFVPLS